MPLRPILCLLLAGLLAGSALLSPVPLTLNPSFDPGPLTLDPPSAHADGPGDWPMFGHDPARTGYNPDETQLKPPLRLKWSYTVGAGQAIGVGSYFMSSPTTAGGKLYIGSFENMKLYAFEAITGTLLWSYDAGSRVTSSPAVAGDKVYVGSWNNTLHALSVTNGTVKWTYAMANEGIPSPTVISDVVYISPWQTPIYALNAQTGSLLWSYNTGDYIESSPAVVSDTVYVVSLDGKLYALSASTGALQWTYQIGDAAHFSAGRLASSPAVSNGVVYVGSWNSKVYALNAASGALVWTYQTGDEVRSSPAVAGGVVYVGSYDGKVYALDGLTGAIRWSYTTSGAVKSSPAVANGVVYFGSDDSAIYALDAATGALLWSYTTGGKITSSPAVAGGILYGASHDGKLYAFEAAPPPRPRAPAIIQPQTPTAYDRTPVSGIAEQGLTVKLYANGAYVGQTTAGNYGVWSFVNVPLALGSNILYATATDAAGNTSLLSTPVVVDRVEVWAPPPAPQASAVITTTGGTVAAGNNVTVTVPSGAFAEEVNLTLTPYAAASAPGVFGVVSANAYTSITAVATSSGAKVSTFQQPITITIAYDPALLGGVPEASLQVSYYDEATSRWMALPSVVDTVNHTVSAQTSRFSVYDAQVSLLTNKVYLPLVSRSAGGW